MLIDYDKFINIINHWEIGWIDIGCNNEQFMFYILPLFSPNEPRLSNVWHFLQILPLESRDHVGRRITWKFPSVNLSTSPALRHRREARDSSLWEKVAAWDSLEKVASSFLAVFPPNYFLPQSGSVSFLVCPSATNSNEQNLVSESGLASLIFYPDLQSVS